MIILVKKRIGREKMEELKIKIRSGNFSYCQAESGERIAIGVLENGKVQINETVISGRKPEREAIIPLGIKTKCF